MQTVDSGCLRCVTVGSRVTAKVSLWRGTLTMREAVRVWGQGVSWEFSVLSTQFCWKPKIALKNSFLIKKKKKKALPLQKVASGVQEPLG